MQKLGKCNSLAPFLGLFALPVVSGLGICTLFPSKKRSTSQLPLDAIFLQLLNIKFPVTLGGIKQKIEYFGIISPNYR